MIKFQNILHSFSKYIYFFIKLNIPSSSPKIFIDILNKFLFYKSSIMMIYEFKICFFLMILGIRDIFKCKTNVPLTSIPFLCICVYHPLSN